MSLLRLPPIVSVPRLENSERAAILDHLFEPCVSLHTLSLCSLRDQTFATYDDLIRYIGAQLNSLAESSTTTDTVLLNSILKSHPRLGENVSSIESTQSRTEQAQLTTAGEAGSEDLQKLNLLYEQTFPGLRYVYVRSITLRLLLQISSVFVNGRSRPTIMKNMAARIDRADIARERADAIEVECSSWSKIMSI